MTCCGQASRAWPRTATASSRNPVQLSRAAGPSAWAFAVAESAVGLENLWLTWSMGLGRSLYISGAVRALGPAGEVAVRGLIRAIQQGNYWVHRVAMVARGELVVGPSRVDGW
jgi:hypothetical protein